MFSSSRRFSVLSALPVLLVACGDSDAELGETSSELKAPSVIALGSGGQILGVSADGRRVAFGIGCDSEHPTIRLFDDRSGAVTELATDASCMPGAVTFSADGRLVAFGNGMGEIRVHDTLRGATKAVSRSGMSGIGIVFSPDSKWWVVATMGDDGSAALDAWEPSMSAPFEIATGAFFSPFGAPADSVRFSADGSKLVYLGSIAAPLPVGSLTSFERATHTQRVLATGVPVTSYAIARDGTKMAYVRGAVAPASTPGEPPSPNMIGDLVVRDLSTDIETPIEQHVSATPLGFARCGVVVYSVDGRLGAPVTLKGFGGGASQVIDTNVFRSFGPSPTASINAQGDAIAYLSAFDPMHFHGELRVASLPRCAASALTKSVVATDAVPMSARWAAQGNALVFLRASTTSMPGAAVGTLAAWNRVTHATQSMATDVTQNALHVDEASDEIRYVSAYDAAMATGELRVWNVVTASSRLLGSNAAVMTVQASPRGDYVGFLSMTASADPQTPPTTRLELARTSGRGAARVVAVDATSLAIGKRGHVVYATSAGVYRANAF